MLWRALGKIQNGFYVDVGANDPLVDSVTKVFYDHGWNGINIEPNSACYEKLVKDRPRDINLRIGVGSKDEKKVFYDFGNGLSTFDRDQADKISRDTSFKYSEVRDMEIHTLNTILQGQDIHEIHFLKIDAEGFENQILQGIDLDRWRPWIVVVEATAPLSQDRVDDRFASLLCSVGYTQAYFDGINDFFLSREHPELSEAFSIPPNWFDGFALNLTCHPWNRVFLDRLEELQRRLDQSEDRYTRLMQEIHTKQEESQTVSVQKVYPHSHSNVRKVYTFLSSWNTPSKPIRYFFYRVLRSGYRTARKMIRGLGGNGRAQTLSIRRLAKVMALSVLKRLYRFKCIRKLGAVLLKPFPRLKERLRRIARKKIMPNEHGNRIGSLRRECLTPRAKELYVRLNQK